jgi:hypothetical protein
VILFRHADPRFPFLWETADQPVARWHGDREGPAHYFADTPDGAWAEFLRHEEIKAPEDLLTIRRALWAVDVPDEPATQPNLPLSTLVGGRETYDECRAEARRLRAAGVVRLTVPSAALRDGGARGWRVEAGLQPASPRNGQVTVLFGARPDLTGWAATVEGRPSEDLLEDVRHFP